MKELKAHTKKTKESMQVKTRSTEWLGHRRVPVAMDLKSKNISIFWSLDTFPHPSIPEIPGRTINETHIFSHRSISLVHHLERCGKRPHLRHSHINRNHRNPHFRINSAPVERDLTQQNQFPQKIDNNVLIWLNAKPKQKKQKTKPPDVNNSAKSKAH